MDKKGKLGFELVNVFGESILEKTIIALECQDLTDRQRADADASGPFVIPGLHGPPNNLYKVQIDAPGYRTVAFFASAQEAETPTNRIVFMAVEPKKVVRVNFPGFENIGNEAQTLLERSERVLGFAAKKGEALYADLDNLRKAGFLNIIAKSRRTRLSNGRNVLSYFAEELSQLQEIRRDRFFLIVPKELREETKNSVPDTFDVASGLLHHPPAGFKPAGSFKTADRTGNLQLSFFARGNDFVADVDIDDANGFAHVFQLIQNIGGSTHPYNIHQILVRAQEIDPGYRLFVR